MTDLSIIIPVYREPLAILRQLYHLRSCPGIARCEVIVVDGDDGSSLTPTDILPLTVLDSPPGRGVQLDRGARSSRAKRLLFLHVDTILPRRFLRLVCSALDRSRAGAFDLSIDSGNPIVRLISFFGLIRSRLSRLPYGDQAHFMTRELYERCGGYPHAAIMEDVALMDAVRAAGERVSFISAPARTSDRRWEQEGAIFSTLRNWRLMLAYRSGVPPWRLAGRYRRQADLEQQPLRVLVFHRSLRLEGLKTRLARKMGAVIALDLYRACVRTLEKEVERSGISAIWFVDDPAAGAPVHTGAIPQHGATLLARMEDAFARVFAAGAEHAILVGSDIPTIDAGILHKAAAGLRHADAVLGPTYDGGYYLVGFRRSSFIPGLLTRESGETDDLAVRTVEVMRQAGLRVSGLPVLRDLDTPEDLAQILEQSKTAPPRLQRVVRRRKINLSVY